MEQWLSLIPRRGQTAGRLQEVWRLDFGLLISWNSDGPVLVAQALMPAEMGLV